MFMLSGILRTADIELILLYNACETVIINCGRAKGSLIITYS